MAYNSSRLYAPNGRIHPTIRLACALRFFAGGDPLDIMTSYGISKTEVHNSIDYIIQAVNDCGDMDILFPTDHEEQKKIAEGFKALSDADIDNCVGPIDGISEGNDVGNVVGLIVGVWEGTDVGNIVGLVDGK